mgnify:CR=1 FL=1
MASSTRCIACLTFSGGTEDLVRAMLQKASLQEIQNDTRGAAYTYRMALRSITPATRAKEPAR